MNLDLPLSLNVNGVDRPIFADFRDVINILIACNDSNLSPQEKALVVLSNLYEDDFESFGDTIEAYEKACKFIDWDKEYVEKEDAPKVVDWQKDYNYIISAVNKVTKTEVRSADFLHWWTFLGYFQERGECQYSTITEIRDKLNHGKKLELYEKEFLRNNREAVIIESEELDEFSKELLGE